MAFNKNYLIILILNYNFLSIFCNNQELLQDQQQQQQNVNIQQINNQYLNLLNLIEPKLRIYLRELKDNSLLLLIYVEPQIKEIEISEYQVNYINKISNNEQIKIELNHDLSKRLLVELKELYQNTPYKICIKAKLQLTCNNLSLINPTKSLSNNLNYENFYKLLNQYCSDVRTIQSRNGTNSINIINNKKILISNCIDNIITQKSISLQALSSSLGAIITLLIIMSCVYLIQMCKPGKALQKLNCRKAFTVDDV